MILVDGRAGTLTLDDWSCPCVIGKGGLIAAADKREGDGATPIGDWAIKGALLRPGRIGRAFVPNLPWRWIRESDGWCDDPADPAHNRPVQLPRPTSHERLARDDQAYDVIIVLGHNDAPPVPGMGSAIFFHLSEGRPTAGCVAVDRDDMLRLLPLLSPGDVMTIA